MSRIAFRFVVLCIALSATAAPAAAQITWNVTYQDVINGSNQGFNNPTVVSGSITIGQLRRDSVTAATNYLNTVLDGRGSTSLHFNVSQTDGSGFLASFGAGGYSTSSSLFGSFQGGAVYQAARSGNAPFGAPHGSGTVDFGYDWHYDVPGTNTTLAGSSDLVSVMIHEIGHSLGFLSLSSQNGIGFANRPLGTPDVYSTLDMFFQKGNVPNTNPLFNTNITQSGFGSFVGDANTFRGGNTQIGGTFTNNTTNGLYFNGPITNEVFNAPVPMYSPVVFESGSSVSHVNVGPANVGLMNFQITDGVSRRFRNYEIAMLMDMGWNVYHWNDSEGNWLDGVNDLDLSRWRTDRGIVRKTNLSNSPFYNINAAPLMAPILPVYGQTTSNIILNFTGLGSTGYTSTNDIGNVRLARLYLNSTSSAVVTIQGGSLQFGVSSDGTASILSPKIVQQNTGVFAINSDIIITNTTAAPGGGWIGLTVDGPGSGTVSLGGVISGTGTLTKAGTFILEMNGNSANTYTGATTINAGMLRLSKPNGVNAIVGNVTLNTGGTLRLAAADQIQGNGTGGVKVTLSGGTLSTGETAGFSDIVGSFEMTLSSTIALGTGSHNLQFTGILGAPSGTLTITGWSATPGGGHVLFSNLTGDPNTNPNYANLRTTTIFSGFGTGATFLDMGGGVYELSPVPEPATILAVASATLGFGALIRRRFGRKGSIAVSEPRLVV